MFIRKEDTLTIIAIHVDDLMILAANILELQRLRASLILQLKMKDIKDMKDIELFGSLQRSRQGREASVHSTTAVHRKDIQELKFGQTEAKSVSTPADLNVKLQKVDGVSRPVDTISYQSIVGSLL